MDDLQQISRYLLERVRDDGFDKAIAARLLGQLQRSAREDGGVAIVGMAGRFAGCETLEDFWRLIAEGDSSIGQFPDARRQDVTRLAGPAGSFASEDFFSGGYLEHIDRFNPAQFRISPAEARLMDPYQRLMLMAADAAILDAGYTRAELAGTRLGVFIGTDHTHKLMVNYGALLEHAGDSTDSMLGVTGSCTGLLASRVSYVLDARGPAVVVDTACSSGLVALHWACRALAAGECDRALVGGVNLFLCPLNKGKLSDVESAVGQLRAFDRHAAGTVWGEGVAAVLLEPVARAVALGDPVRAVIRGSAVNNDGASNGITAPRAESQTDVLKAAWKQAGISPATLGLLEAHGTGTLLGDPIEIKGLAAAVREHTAQTQFLAIGSVKANLGHTVGASGMASLFKSVLALQKGLLPPSCGFDNPNPFISFIDSPVYVNDVLRPWPAADHPRRAAVTSLGFSGTNCHVVLEAYERSVDEGGAEGPELMLLSASSEAALGRYEAQIFAWLDAQGRDSNLAPKLRDICFTLAAGRSHYAHRRAYLVQQSVEPRRLAASESAASADAVAQALSNCTAEAGLNEQQLSWLGGQYLLGGNADWRTLYRPRRARKVNLPVPAPECERYWPQGATLPSRAAPQVLPEPASPEQVPPEQAPVLTFTSRATAVLAKVLGYATLDTRASFHALGGDSILAINVVHALQSQLGFRAEVADLLRSRNIDEFLQHVSVGQSLQQTQQGGVPRLPRSEYYALSSAQRRIFALTCVEDTDVRYNVPLAVSIRGSIEPGRVQQSLRRLVERHAALRSSFQIQDGAAVSCVSEDVSRFSLSRVVAEPGRINDVVRRFVRPFDVAAGSLFRAELVAFGAKEHVLLLDMHHLVADGTSVEVLLKDFICLYHEQPLEPLPCEFVDFAAWQNARFASDALALQERFWLSRFETGVPVLELPTTHPRPTQQSYAGARLPCELPRHLARAVADLAKATNSTVYMVLLAAFNVLLAKYCGQSDIVVGSPIAGRTHPSTVGVVGVFINTLAHRNQLRPEQTFQSFLEQVRDNALEAYSNQEYPIERLVEKLVLRRDLGRNPLFDVMLVMQASGTPEVQVGPLSYAGYPLENRTAKVDLTLQVTAVDDALRMELEYCTALFDAAFAARFVAHLQHVLGQVTQCPQLSIEKISVLPPAERQRLLVEFNATQLPLAPDFDCLTAFDEQVKRAPTAVAVQFGAHSLSYAELDRWSDAVARGLRTQGARIGQIIGILLQPSEYLLPAILGALKSGAAYLPLDPQYPQARIDWMLQHSGAQLVITEGAAAAPSTQQLDVRRLVATEHSAADVPGSAKACSADPAYVIYTSGSTGKPKGVVVTHGNVANFIAGMGRVADFSAGRRIVCCTTICFDIFVLESLLPLARGMTVVLADAVTRAEPGELAALIQEQQVHVLQATPSRMASLLASSPGPALFESLDAVLIGGEAFPPALLPALRGSTRARVVNVYGPTETTVWSTTACLDDGDGVISIGQPLANTQIYVVDTAGQLCPIGVAGELCIAGAGVAQGYLNAPELTQERFVACPFAPNTRMYRTGDLAKWRDDGRLECLGRRDQQVKLRGYRIELGEIEGELGRCPGVDAAAVVKRTRADGSEFLSAFYVAGTPKENAELRTWLGRHLPEYMLPSVFTRIAAMPLTNNGKLDRLALPAERNTEANAVQASAERSETSDVLARVLGKVLGVEQVQPQDDYFALGGDSIRAVSIVAAVRQEGFQLYVRDVLQLQTVAAIAKAMSPLLRQQPTHDLHSAQLMPFQHWMLQHAGQRLSHYNLCFALEGRTRFDAQRLEQALHSVLDVHAALSLRLDLEAQPTPVLRQMDRASLAFEVADLRDAAGFVSRIAQLTDALQRGLDVERGQMFGALLIRAAQADHLVLVVNQLVIDHVSWRYLLADLVAAYQGASGNEPARDPSAYLRWMNGLQTVADSEQVLAELPYWNDVESVGVTGLPVERPRGTNLNADAKSLWIECLGASATTRWLQQSGRAGHHAVEATLLTALAEALAEWTGLRRHVINLGFHGRNELVQGLEQLRTVGRFTALFPFVLQVEGESGLARMSHVTHALESVPNDGVGYGLLRHKSQLHPGASPLGLNPTLAFSYMGQFDTDLSNDLFTYSKIPTGPTIDPEMNRAYELNVVALVAWGRLQLRIDYSHHRYTARTIERLGRRFKRSFAALSKLVGAASQAPARGTAAALKIANAQTRVG